MDKSRLMASGNMQLVLDTSFDRMTKRPNNLPTTLEDATYLETTSTGAMQ